MRPSQPPLSQALPIPPMGAEVKESLGEGAEKVSSSEQQGVSGININKLENPQAGAISQFPQLPPQFTLPGNGAPLQSREASTQAANISSLLKQKILVLIEESIAKHALLEKGIYLELKDFTISSTIPATIEAIIKSNIPQGERGFVQSVLSELYSKVTDVLADYIDENDSEYKNAMKLSEEQQEEMKEKLNAMLSGSIPKETINNVLQFRKGKPICSVSPRENLDKNQVAMLLEHIELLCAEYKTVAIFFIGEVEIIEDKEKAERNTATMRIRAHRGNMHQQEKEILAKRKEEEKEKKKEDELNAEKHKENVE